MLPQRYTQLGHIAPEPLSSPSHNRPNGGLANVYHFHMFFTRNALFLHRTLIYQTSPVVIKLELVRYRRRMEDN